MRTKFNTEVMRMLRRTFVTAAVALAAMVAVPLAQAQEQRDGYKGAPRTEIWSPVQLQYTDTAKYKKEGPYVIGFSNASVDNTWRLAQLHAIQAAAATHKDLIKQLIITDANNSPAKQVSDIEDLLQRGVDILLVSASKSDALDPIDASHERRHSRHHGGPPRHLREFRELRHGLG